MRYTARAYTGVVADDGRATIRFGDGSEGARLPTGRDNVRATYRKGIGVAGNVASGKLGNLMSRPLGVSGISNPQAASGGEDPESLADAKRNAPLTALTLDRAVSVLDYRDYARAFAGIAKAHALWIPSGPAHGVFLTIAGIAGAAVSTASTTYVNLMSSLRQYGDPLVPLMLRSYRSVSFRVKASLKVAADAETDKVLEEAEAVLKEAFGFEARDFGQTVSVDGVASVLHSVSGIEAVQISELYRLDPGATPKLEPRLFAFLPVASPTSEPLPAELLVLEEDPPALEVMP